MLGILVNGFVSGFGYEGCMVMVLIVVYDSYYMIVVGISYEDMVFVVNCLGDVGGGVIVFKDGKEIVLVELFIVGLMFDEFVKIVFVKV